MERVMVIDDEELLLKSLGRILANEHYELKLVSSGEEALRLLGEFKPDAIILDVKMSGIDGLEVCRSIRNDKNENIRSIPIIMITGHYYEKEEILKAGADDFLEKPIDRSDIIIRLRCILKVGKLSGIQERRNAYLEELKKSGMDW